MATRQHTIQPHHADLLVRSGISEDFARQWGVFSVASAEDLTDTDLYTQFANAPSVRGLCFPLRMVDGAVTYQLRLEDSDLAEGQGKYAQASGWGAILNIPATRAHLVGKAERVFIVEGTKQTIALSRYAPDDVLVIGIQGCHNFSRAGVPLAEIAEIIGSGQPEVTVFFDADWKTNRAVWDAASDLTSHLTGTMLIPDKRVRIATPTGGAKLGIDDQIGAAVDSDEFRRMLVQTMVDKASNKLGRAPAKKAPKASVRVSSPLTMDLVTGTTTRTSADPNGNITTVPVLPLAARIVRAEAHIDEETGDTSSQDLRLEVMLENDDDPANPHQRFVSVPSSQLANLGSWFDKLPGAIGVRLPRDSKPADEIANAIRAASDDIVSVSVVPHTGWTYDREEEQMVWCDGSGALGPDGKRDHLRGAPASRDFQEINLPDVSRLDAQTIKDGVREFVMLRQFFSEGKEFAWDVGVAAWGLAFLGVTPNAAVCYFGPPSSGKSTIAQTLSSSLNAGWAPRSGAAMSTFNASAAGMDLLPNGLANCFLHVDDLKPESDSRAMAQALKGFDSLLRRAHGSGGAVRGTIDRQAESLAVRKVDSAAPMMIITGEEIPSGETFAESGMDRALFIQVQPKSLLPSSAHLERVIEVAASGRLKIVTAAYITHLAARIDAYTGSLNPTGRIELGPREAFRTWVKHVEEQRARLLVDDTVFQSGWNVSDRAKMLAASLIVGYSNVLQFAVGTGSITREEMTSLLTTFAAATVAQVREHTSQVMGGNASPAESALAQLRNAVMSRAVSIDATEATTRPLIGVRRTVDGTECVVINHAAAAAAIGFVGSKMALQRALAAVCLPGPDGKSTRSISINGVRVQACAIPVEVWGVADPDEVSGDF